MVAFELQKCTQVYLGGLNKESKGILIQLALHQISIAHCAQKGCVMHTWDWILLILAILTVLGAAGFENGPEDDKAMSGAATVAAFGFYLTLDQVIVGHSGWLYLAGGAFIAGGVIAVLAIVSTSRSSTS
jgi:hypothetical protein